MDLIRKEFHSMNYLLLYFSVHLVVAQDLKVDHVGLSVVLWNKARWMRSRPHLNKLFSLWGGCVGESDKQAVLVW